MNINPEIHFAEELAAHEAQEVASDLRHECKRLKVEDSLREGSEYYPFGWTNFCEAMQNLSAAQLFCLDVQAGSAHKMKSEYAYQLLGCALVTAIEDYWRKAAEANIKEDDYA